ncbi:MAG: MaoC family dehydratase [Deltaproteobacteria bacterium]|jgi:acyl dehydratase|nr:MaoC family dehydratase [Deltaproteobacteria bacterium]MBW2181106.1 MaoC family dehydratase [Deltaproteobacteria bacterium]
MSEIKGLDKIMALVGQEVGLSDWFEVDQERINKFAEATEDYQWIHVDKEKAEKGPFGTTIAHGYLTVSLISYLSSCINLPLEGMNIQMAVNYGLNKVRLLNPVAVNSKIRTRVVLKDVVEKDPGRILMTYAHTIEIEGQEKPACVAENLGMLFVQ